MSSRSAFCPLLLCCHLPTSAHPAFQKPSPTPHKLCLISAQTSSRLLAKASLCDSPVLSSASCAVTV